MATMFSWKEVDPGPGEPVAPDERLAWGKTVGIGAQHVMAMFGATFVFPAVMGLSPNLAILMSGIATICFLLIVQGKVPSYLGTSASFVGVATAIYAHPGAKPSDVTGAILVAGIVLAIIGVIVHFAGAGVVNAVLPPVLTGAVVMLIGFNLAPVAATTYMPADPWIAIITMVATILMAVGLKGFAGRIAVFLGLVVGYVLSWVSDLLFGDIHSVLPGASAATDHARVSWAGVKAADWFGFPPHTPDSLTGNQGFNPALSGQLGWHAPSFSLTFILLAIPAVIALTAENTGHVKAVAEMTKTDLDPYLGRAIAADGVGTVIASAVGGSPTTTYAENIGVMAATRVYSTAAYFVAAIVAIVLGFVPKFGQVVDATPGGALGGVTLVLYGMIGLLGAKIWKENNVDFARPVNLVPIAAGIILGIVSGSSLKIAHNFTLSGIALGTVVAVGGYHLARLVSHDEEDQGAMIVAGGPDAQTTGPASGTDPESRPSHRSEPSQE